MFLNKMLYITFILMYKLWQYLKGFFKGTGYVKKRINFYR